MHDLPSVLQQPNHTVAVVGKRWKLHRFVKSRCERRIILRKLNNGFSVARFNIDLLCIQKVVNTSSGAVKCARLHICTHKMPRRVPRRLRKSLSLFCFFVCPVNNSDCNSEYQRNNKRNDQSGDIADQNKHNKNNDDQSARQRINPP